MKRYLLFAGNYAPALNAVATGGWNDFVKDFDSIEEATAYWTNANNPNVVYNWGQVVDLVVGKVVA